MTMLNQNAPQGASQPLAEYSALTKETTLLKSGLQEEIGQVAKKGNLSEAVSSALAEVLASRFMRAITGMALGGIASEGTVHSASAVEAPNNAQPIKASSSDVATAHPHTCGRQTLPRMHSYDRD